MGAQELRLEWRLSLQKCILPGLTPCPIHSILSSDTILPMYVPLFYLVAGGNAYALDEDNMPFGAPVRMDATIDWDAAYDFDPDQEDIEFVAHMIKYVQDSKKLHEEQFNEVFYK